MPAEKSRFNLSWLFVVLLLESILILTFIPGQYMERLITQESELIRLRFGVSSYDIISDKAIKTFNSTLVDNGLYERVYNYFIEVNPQSNDVFAASASPWFNWLGGRIEALSMVYYHILLRTQILIEWAPYFLVLLVPSFFDGWTTWRIKRVTFRNTSPYIHTYSTKLVRFSWIFIIITFLLPVVLDPLVIPAFIIVLCVLIGLAMGNLQKRL